MDKTNRNHFFKAAAVYLVMAVAISAAAIVRLMVVGGTDPLVSIFVVEAVVLLTFIYALYGFMSRKRLVANLNELCIVCASILSCYSFCIFAETISVFLMPAFMTAFLLAPLIKRKDSFAANAFCVLLILITLAAQGHSGLTLLAMPIVGFFTGTLVVFTLSYERKRLDFLLKGVAIVLASIVLVLSFNIINQSLEGVDDIPKALLNTLIYVSISMFAQLILSLVLQPLLEKIFNILTNPRLVELTDHNSPLIRRLIEEAPGTFNHSLTVANFAEVCATAIGENPYFARTCAYYHDIGKLINPQFFKENQPAENPHDDILPEVSADIIKKHTTEGLALCREYRIPKVIASITTEHHGTMPISVFYNKAKELTDAEVDIRDYSYTASIPSSKTAAIIMICDSAEAAIRSLDHPDAEKADIMVDKLISERISAHQFDDCPITIMELNIIKETIVSSCGGVFHTRLKYPDGK